MMITAVESTTLTTVAYDSTGQLLWLEFRNHAVYCYSAVPTAVHRDLLEADSKGKYFNRYIRHRFPYQRVASMPVTPFPATVS